MHDLSLRYNLSIEIKDKLLMNGKLDQPLMNNDQVQDALLTLQAAFQNLGMSLEEVGRSFATCNDTLQRFTKWWVDEKDLSIDQQS
jgi:hypothetical protein